MTFPSGQTRTFTYDDQGRLTGLTNADPVAGNLATYGYAYDLNHTSGQWDRLGQRVTMTATVPSQGLSGHQMRYEYDNLYQLTKATYPNVAPFNGEVHSWTYDGIGNRLTNRVNTTTQSYTYQRIGANPLNWQRLVNDGVNAYTYDAKGNVQTRTGFTFGWTDQSRLRSLSGGVAASYRYDYQGRRTVRTVGAATNTYVFDGLNLIRESGATPAEYLFGPGIDEPLAMVRGGQAYYYATDGLGSVSLVTNASGAVQNSYVYDAWGVTRSQTGSLGNPFGYTARELGEAGSLFYRARQYSPGIGRFLSEDPLRERSGDEKSLYRYVLNGPLSSTDPLGLFKIDPSCDCRPGGPPPGAAPNWGSELIRGGLSACQRLHEITDPSLRRCMERTCDSGTIECLDNCPTDVAGHTDFIFFGVVNRTSGICTNNWTPVRPHLADTVLHEFAHGCGWGHGQGRGVPGNTGTGFD